MARDNDGETIKYNTKKCFLGSISRNGSGSDVANGSKRAGEIISFVNLGRF